MIRKGQQCFLTYEFFWPEHAESVHGWRLPEDLPVLAIFYVFFRVNLADERFRSGVSGLSVLHLANRLLPWLKVPVGTFFS